MSEIIAYYNDITIQISVVLAQKYTNRPREQNTEFKFRDRLLMYGNFGNLIHNKVVT